MKIFKDRIAFVTGGASGIGYGMVQNFLKEGMKVVIADFNRAHLVEVQAALGARKDVHLVHVDVGDRDQLRAAMLGRVLLQRNGLRTPPHETRSPPGPRDRT